MDSQTTIKELKEKIKKFSMDREWQQYHNAKDLSIGVITESSELLEHFRFKSEIEIEEMFKDSAKRQEIEEEVADVLFFLFELADKYEIDISKAFYGKLEKNEKRYPIEKVKGKNKKYDEI